MIIWGRQKTYSRNMMNRKRKKLFKVFRRFCALHPFSVKHTLLLCLCLICVEHPGFTGCETGRSLNILMLIPLSVLARCFFFLSLFSLFGVLWQGDGPGNCWLQAFLCILLVLWWICSERTEVSEPLSF